MAKYDGIEKYISSQTYLFFLNYCNGTDTDSYWDEVVDTGGKLCKEFDYHPMAVAFVGEYINQLEHKIGNKNRNGKTYRQWEQTLNKYKRKYNLIGENNNDK